MQNSLDMIHQIKDYRPQADAHRYEQFIGSDLYWDFKNEMMARIIGMQDTLSDIYVNNTQSEIFRTQGGLIAMELVINIFENLFDNRKSELEIPEEEGNEENL